MRYLYISDLHLYHKNILSLCNRPFKDLDEMHEAILSNWNKKVRNDDTVIIGGDVGFPRNNEEVKLITEYLKKINGKKILVVGNHDHKLLKNSEFGKCFESVHNYLEVNDNGKRVVIFHYPIEEWNHFFRDAIHLYGHVHNNDKGLKKIKNRFNMCADVNDFTPMLLKEFIKK